jgi:hypothetical protein
VLERKGNPGNEEGMEEDETIPILNQLQQEGTVKYPFPALQGPAMLVIVREARYLLFERKANPGKQRRSEKARAVPGLGRTEFRTVQVDQQVREKRRKRQGTANVQMRKKVESQKASTRKEVDEAQMDLEIRMTSRRCRSNQETEIFC